MKSALDKLAESFGLNIDNTRDVLERLDALKWLGGDTLSAIRYAGVINNGDTNKTHGNNGYFIATDDNLCWVTNGDPVWEDNTDDNCIDAYIELGNSIN